MQIGKACPLIEVGEESDVCPDQLRAEQKKKKKDHYLCQSGCAPMLSMACQQDYTKTFQLIFLKLGVKIGHVLRRNPLNSGSDPCFIQGIMYRCLAIML